MLILLTELHKTNDVDLDLVDCSDDFINLQPKHDLDIVENSANKVRSFSMYGVLEKPLLDFIEDGDGVNALPVFEEEYFPDADLVDSTLINLVKLISTAFGRSRLPEAYKIIERIHIDGSKLKNRSFRFRSRHPLFTDGSQKYQNVCLVSGMVHLGIPILPYFDGEKVLPFEADQDVDRYLNMLRSDNGDLI